MEILNLKNLLLRNKNKTKASSVFLVCISTFILLAFCFTVGPTLRLPVKLSKAPQLFSPIILDRFGLPIQTPLNSREERSQKTTLSNIPENLLIAFILAEDKRFFSHHGVDIKALARALINSIEKGKIVSGASTLNMQLSRIYWPQLGKPQYKLAQIFQSIKMDVFNSKSVILEHYLNTVPFSKQTIGIEQACLKFYNRTCSLLSLSESASLAIIPRNPNYYFNHPEALIVAKNKLIQKMSKQLNLKDEVRDQALTEVNFFENHRPNSYAHHFVEYVRKNLKNINQHNQIKTTLDLKLQLKMENLLKEHIKQNPGLGDTGAILIVNSRSGDVLSYVGGPEYFNKDNGMFDNIHALRSPGSTLKPFLYILALEKGWTLSSVLPDLPISFPIPSGTFRPRNYNLSFSGPQQIRYALANSKNLPALYLTSLIGTKTTLDFFKDLGFQGMTKDSEHYGIGVSLGNAEVSLWELAQAYTTLANQGRSTPLSVFLNPTDSLNQFAQNTNSAQKFSQDAAYLITHTLSDPIARSQEFGRDGPLEHNISLAVKTGTSSQYRDHWVVGYTPGYTIGVWKGNTNGSPMKAKRPSSAGAGKLFKSIVLNLVQSNDKTDLKLSAFERPKNVITKMVCSLSGDLSTSACNQTRHEHFMMNQVPTQSCDFHKQHRNIKCNGKKINFTSTELPEVYKSWAKTAGIFNFENYMNENCQKEGLATKIQNTNTTSSSTTAHQFKIVEPLDGSIYAFDPNVPKSHQKIRVMVSGNGDYKSLRLMSGSLSLESSFEFINDQTFINWPISKGHQNFRLEYKGNSIGSPVHIKVF